MGQTIIKLKVDTVSLKNADPSTSWAKITQNGGVNSAPNQDPDLFVSQVYQGDEITWVGEAVTLNAGTGDPQPVINITEIELSREIAPGTFGEPVINTFWDGGSTVTMTALQDFGSLAPQNYTIHFTISYKGRFLDPKIKIIAH